jgi:hypothetical protein
MRLAQLAPRGQTPRLVRSLLVTGDLAQSGLGWTESDLVRAKVVGALAGAAFTAAVTLIAPIGPLVVIAAAYAGFILPTLRVDRAAAHRRSEAERALVTLVEWAEALVASGRPVETAFVSISERGVGGRLIDDALAAALRSYALGERRYFQRSPARPRPSNCAPSRVSRPILSEPVISVAVRSWSYATIATVSADRSARGASMRQVASKDGSCSFWSSATCRR